MFLKKFLPLSSTFLFFVFWEIANKLPNQMLYWGLGGLIVALISVFFLRRVWLKEKIEFKIFWSSLFLFLVGSFLIFIFLDRPLYRQMIIGLTCFSFFLEMYYAALYLRQKKEFYLSNLAVLNEFFPVLSFGFLVAGFFGWLVFLKPVLWLFVVLVCLISVQTGYNLFYNSLGKKFIFSPLWVVSLIAAEMFWAINFLPVGFLVKGFILTLVWWVFSKILIEYGKKENKQKVRIHVYFLLAIILIVIILFSARWL